MKTLQENRRDCVESLFGEVIKKEAVSLTPISITCAQDANNRGLKVSFSFKERASGADTIRSFEEVTGDSFVGCIFDSCLGLYKDEYSSLSNLVIKDFLVKPVFFIPEVDPNTPPDTDIILRVEVKNRGVAEFVSKSRSIIYSGFSTTLSAIQFYLNCEKSFHRLNFLAKDARTRNRGDLYSKYAYELSIVTEMNRYDI